MDKSYIKEAKDESNATIGKCNVPWFRKRHCNNNNRNVVKSLAHNRMNEEPELRYGISRGSRTEPQRN